LTIENTLAGPNAMSCLRVLLIATCISAVTPRLSGDIVLLSRLSDARASAHANFDDDSPPPQIQTDFLPATLGNSATASPPEGGYAHAHSTSNSSIVTTNPIGSLRVTGDGIAHADAFGGVSSASASAKLIVLSFTITDSYLYLMTGELHGDGCINNCSTATARLTGETGTIFEKVGTSLAESGLLPPGTYTLSVDVYVSTFAKPGYESDANFIFALDPSDPSCDALSENFDGVIAPMLPEGWIASNPDPGDGIQWVTSSTTPDTAPNAAFIPDQDDISDKVLDSQSITIGSAAAQISFRNNYDMEFSDGIYWDGGVLEVSSPNINGGEFLDITDSQVGGSFVSGGYTGQIPGDASNPLAGRMAWGGSSVGYINSVANLGPNVNGQTIRLRFRIGSDTTGAAPGWRIDTMVVTGGSCPTPTPGTPTATPIISPTATPTHTPTPTLTPSETPTPTPTPAAAETHAQNLSTRLLVQTGADVGIAGFIITGSSQKQVLLRGIGPSLGGSGVANPLADPVLEFGGTTNDNWRDTQEAEIMATGIAPSNDLESAILVTLDPGAYTAILRGKNDGTGVGLVEIYDLSQGGASKLANLSTRAQVGTGSDIVITGLSLSGGSSDDVVLLRGIGPSLASSGVTNVLANPTLELRNNDGAVVATNDDWQNGPPVSLPPTDPLESAIQATLSPGAYTALLSGVNKGTGVGLVEVYDLASP
jgi:hypothetical protein